MVYTGSTTYYCFSTDNPAIFLTSDNNHCYVENPNAVPQSWWALMGDKGAPSKLTEHIARVLKFFLSLHTSRVANFSKLDTHSSFGQFSYSLTPDPMCNTVTPPVLPGFFFGKNCSSLQYINLMNENR